MLQPLDDGIHLDHIHFGSAAHFAMSANYRAYGDYMPAVHSVSASRGRLLRQLRHVR